ncbi:MAG TPA: DnaB-like helicase C-terminal domain-containing protein, partial [Firmicutes bacterium]|nr:DnaB-like helicase C-terminal domain-containing protein [Bacillota bacterium]
SLWNAGEGFSRAKIFVDDTSNITVAQMLSKCRRLKSKHGLDMVLVDYIQLMQSDDHAAKENRQQEVASISRGLKLMARELNVPVLALSQLRREQAANRGKKPQLSDLRESGAIEQDADIVLMIYKPDEEGEAETDAPSTRVELVVAKHRNGPLGDIPMDWVGEIVRFREADPYSLAITKQFNENKRAKKEKEEAKAAAERNGLEGADFPPDEPPPETEGTVIDGEIL